MEGGTGRNVYLVDNAQDKVTDTYGIGVVRSTAETFTLPNLINRLELIDNGSKADAVGYGNNADNEIIASSEGNNMSGLGGHNDLRGGVGSHGLDGGAGNDTLNGGEGADYLGGGDGDDLYLAVSAIDIVIEYAQGGSDTLNITTASLVLPDFVENVRNDYSGGTVNSAGSKVFGNKADNRITTCIGSDSLFGAGGDDTLTGGRGDDVFGVSANFFYRPITTITDFVTGTDKIALHSQDYGIFDKLG